MSKQQTSILSFFGGGGGRRKSKKSDDIASAAAQKSTGAADTKKQKSSSSDGNNAALSLSSANKQTKKKTNSRAPAAVAAASNKKRSIDEDPPQNQRKKKMATTVQTDEDVVSTITVTPCKLPLSTAATTTPPCSPTREQKDCKSIDIERREDKDIPDKGDKGCNNIDIDGGEDEVTPTAMLAAVEDNNASADTNDKNDTDDSDAEGNNANEVGSSQQQNDSDDGGHYQLSEYELLRLRNIERNSRRLAELGLAGGSWGSNAEQNKKKKQRRNKVKGDDAIKSKVRVMPTRRSTCNRRSVLDGSTDETFSSSSLAEALNYQEVEDDNIVEEEEAELFTVSPVLDYALDTTSDTPSDGESKEARMTDEWSSTSVSPHAITSLKPIGKRLAPPNGLNAIYSLQFYPKEWSPASRSDDRSWIVGAGKAGIVSLWDCNWSKSDGANDSAEEEGMMIDPVLSWKAHGGRWVADVRFLPAAGNGSDSSAPPSRLLSAANDGCVCLWDLSAVSVQSGAPKLLSKTGKELHRSGIFAMDVSIGEQTYVCTGSKDKTVAVTALDTIARGSYAEPLWVSDYHTAKIGAVALCGKGTSLLASASDDGSIAVHDYRMNGKNHVVAELLNVHYRPHSVAWNPLSENELLTGEQSRCEVAFYILREALFDFKPSPPCPFPSVRSGSRPRRPNQDI